MTDEILIIHSLYSSNRQILVSSYTIRNKANFVSQIIKKDIRNYHWYVIRDKYNLVNTHKLQDPSLLLFSYRAQHKTRKRDGKKFPLRIVELTLRGGERTAADTTVSIAIARRNVSSRRWLLHRGALRGWKALLPVAWKSISACIFNIWLDTWPRIYGHSRNPNTSLVQASLCVCMCVCVYTRRHRQTRRGIVEGSAAGERYSSFN